MSSFFFRVQLEVKVIYIYIQDNETNRLDGLMSYCESKLTKR
jgi:hypothetical protein